MHPNRKMMEKKIKVAFQDPDTRLFEINKLGSNDPELSLTDDEYLKLQKLMPNTKWITIQWVKPPTKNLTNTTNGNN
jgi:hypothetical protein